MSDKITKEHRSWNMSQIKGKDTSIEISVRKALFHDGFRFRKNDKRLPGKPDIVLPKYRTVIFVHGCYWHGHNCKEFHIPKTNSEFWINKFNRNIENDQKHYVQLQDSGWNVIVVWECEIEKEFNETITRIETTLRNNLAIKQEAHI